MPFVLMNLSFLKGTCELGYLHKFGIQLESISLDADTRKRGHMDPNISLLKADVLRESRQGPAGLQVSCPRWPLSARRRDGARQACGPPEGLGPEPQSGEGAGEPCRQLQESFLTLEPLPLRFCRAGGSARRHFDPCFLEIRRIGWGRLRRKALQSL